MQFNDFRFQITDFRLKSVRPLDSTMRYLCVIFLFIPVVLAADVNPESGWYLRFDAGTSNARDPELSVPEGPLPADLGTTPLFGGGIGYSLFAGIRADFTVSTRSGFEQVSGFPEMPEGRAEFQSTAALVTLSLDLLSTERVSPFGGFGFGVARNKIEEIQITNPDGSLLGTIGGESKTGFAWQLCAGIDVSLSDRLNLEFAYHLLDAGEYESDDLLVFVDQTSAFGKSTGTFRANEFQIGLRYTF